MDYKLTLLDKVVIKYWSLKTKIEDSFRAVRLRKVYKYKPFYDKFSKTYRIYFNDRFDECGTIDYVVSEYIENSLYYPFNILGEHTHEHSFNDVLATLMRYNGEGFSLSEEEKQYYSQQEIDILYKYVSKLQADKTLLYS